MIALKKNNSEVRKEALELFNAGLELVEISRRLDVPEGTVRSWKNRYKWQRNVATPENATKKESATLQKKKKGGQPGNKNAVGNQGGSPVKHGLYSKYFTPETREIYESLLDADPLTLLWHNIMFAQAELLRSQQIMFVKDHDDKTVEKVGFTEGKTIGETWTVQQAWEKQADYLKSIARIQAEIRNMIKDYLELEGQSSADAKANAEDWKKAIIEIAKRRGEQHE